MLEVLDDRYGQRSTLADANFGRLIHNAYRSNLQGESMRKHAEKLTASGASD